MVKVKRIVHLEDKNIAEDDGSGPGKTVKSDSVSGKIESGKVNPVSDKVDLVSGKGDSDSGKDGTGPKREILTKREISTPSKKVTIELEDDAQERRSTRKIKKKRHKYGEEEEVEGEEDDFMALLNEVEETPTKSITPIKSHGIKVGPKKGLSTSATGKKRAETALLDDASMETPVGKRPRLARGTPNAAVTPKKATEFFTPLKKDADSPLKRDDPTPLPGTPGNAASSSTPPPPTPPVPKETVMFKAGASNPVGLQNLVDFLIRVLKRKDVLGFFAHPPTETLCPGYFSRVEVPMDFDLIQQKFDAGFYKDLPTFRGDAMLLFENAMKYYDKSSMTYHSARKLRHFIRKTTSKDRVLGMKLAFPALLADIGVEELGLDEAELTGEDGGAAGTSAALASTAAAAAASATTGARDDEGNIVVEIEEPTELLADEDLKIEWILKEKEDNKSTTTTLSSKTKNAKSTTPSAAAAAAPKRSAPLSDNATSQEILTSWINGVGNAGRKSSTPISNPIRGNILPIPALPRRDRAEGLTSLSILNPDNAFVHVDANGEALYRTPASSFSRGADNSSMSSAISLKQTLNRLSPSTSSSSAPSGLIAGFKEDRRNMLKPVKYIGASPFCSFGPAFDSRFANLSKGDSDQLVSSFHAEDDLTFARDIKNAVGRAMGGGGGDYELDAVDSLLDVLSGGEYRKRPEVEKEREEFEEAEEKFRKIPATTDAEIPSEDAAAAETTTDSETASERNMDKLLSSAASQIESLLSTQMARLSRAPPAHLGLVSKPSTEELGLADGVTSLLTSMAKEVTPEYLISQRAVFEALGVDLDREAESREVIVGGNASTVKLSAEAAAENAELAGRLDVPTTPVAKAEVPQNVFSGTFNSAISFVAS